MSVKFMPGHFDGPSFFTSVIFSAPYETLEYSVQHVHSSLQWSRLIVSKANALLHDLRQRETCSFILLFMRPYRPANIWSRQIAPRILTKIIVHRSICKTVI